MTSLTNSNLELKNMFGQFMKMNTASSSGSGTLPSNTITNPKKDLKGIITQSGNAYQGPTIPTTSSTPPKVVKHKTEATKDTPVVTPVIEPFVAPVSASKPNPKPSIPYPSRLHDQKLRDKTNDQKDKFFQIFQDLNFNIIFVDALILMPKTPLNEHCSAVLLKILQEKMGDPGKFLIPCNFPGMDECLAMADLGASISLMPLSVWNKLSLPKLSPTCMTLELADRSISPCEEYSQEVLGFSVSGNPTPSTEPIFSNSSPTLTPFGDSDFLLEDIDAFLAIDDVPISPEIDESYYDSEGDILLLEEFLNDDLSSPPLPPQELKVVEPTNEKSSIDETPVVKLKDLPPHLEYAFLEGNDKLPAIITKGLKDEEKPALIKEKSHFMVKEGIVLDHKISKNEIEFAKVMLKYGVTHRLATAYHPQTSGQVEVSNRGLKRILEWTVGKNHASWLDKLDNALYAFRIAFKTPIGYTPYKLVYGKACHLPIELEHKAYWAIKHANFELQTAGDHRKVQINELNELHDQPYENSLIYEEKTKRIYDSKIKNRVFNISVMKLRNEITNFHQRPDESLIKAWERYKLSIDHCPNHHMLPVPQIDTFYNGLTLRYRDTINVAAEGTFMKWRPKKCYDLIENMTAPHNDWDTSAQRSESSSSITFYSDLKIVALKAEMAEINKNLMKVLQINQQVKTVTHSYEACNGPHSYNDCPATVGQTKNVYVTGAYNQGGNSYQPQGNRNLLSYHLDNYLRPPGFKQNQNRSNPNQNYQNRNQGNNHGNPQGNNKGRDQFFQGASHGTLPSNTITNPKEDLKGITNRSGIACKGPTVPTRSSPPKVVERETEVIKDTVPPTNNGSTKDVQPPVVQVETQVPNFEPVVTPVVEPVEAPVSDPKPNTKPSIPYPSRLLDQKLRDKANDQMEKFFQIFQYLNFNISFTDALILMPKFASTIKSLFTNKEKLFELARTPLNEHCSAVLLKKLLEKLGDPGKFLIPCDFPGMDECLSLADLGASINLMPLSVWKMLSLLELSPRCMTLELANRSISRLVRVAKDVFRKVGMFHFSADIVIVDFDADPRVLLILGRSFLKTGRALINVYEVELTLRVGNKGYSQEILGFSVSGNPTPSREPIVLTSSPTLTPFGDSDFLLEETDAFLAIKDELISLEIDDSFYDSEAGILLLEEFLNDDPSSLHLPP
nr:reverse transcriptase domain-containing protein [Tanacetum cinerariifolium]